jgi:hypothetical protein
MVSMMMEIIGSPIIGRKATLSMINPSTTVTAMVRKKAIQKGMCKVVTIPRQT